MTRDIGIALPLPEPYSAELQAWRERFGDRNASAIPPHITLVPPTRLARDDLDEVEEHLRAVAAGSPRFLLVLDGTDGFRPASPVVFVRLVHGAEECGLLQEQVRCGPLARELAFPYHPHVTIAHDLPDPQLDEAERALAGYSAGWRAWGLTLFERGDDGVWRPQRDFPFAGAEVGPAPEPA